MAGPGARGVQGQTARVRLCARECVVCVRAGAAAAQSGSQPSACMRTHLGKHPPACNVLIAQSMPFLQPPPPTHTRSEARTRSWSGRAATLAGAAAAAAFTHEDRGGSEAKDAATPLHKQPTGASNNTRCTPATRPDSARDQRRDAACSASMHACELCKARQFGAWVGARLCSAGPIERTNPAERRARGCSCSMSVLAGAAHAALEANNQAMACLGSRT